MTERSLKNNNQNQEKYFNSKNIVKTENSLSNVIALTHKSMEASFNDRKINILHDIIKSNETNMDSNILQVREFFFSPISLPQLPQFKKPLKISYLNPSKDHSKTKRKIIEKVQNGRDGLRDIISKIARK